MTVAIPLLAGCSQSPYELAAVTGVVTIDGRPFHGGKVMFAPVAKGESRKVGRPSFGLLGTDGRFELTTYEDGDGAVVGEHWATLIQFPPDERDPSATAVPALPDFERVTYPQRVTVASGSENTINLEFTRDHVSRFANRRDK